jgi:hypothetical protein
VVSWVRFPPSPSHRRAKSAASEAARLRWVNAGQWSC